MRTIFGIALAVLCLLGRPAAAETLADLLAREGIDFQVTRKADLGKAIEGGSRLDTPDLWIVATYVSDTSGGTKRGTPSTSSARPRSTADGAGRFYAGPDSPTPGARAARSWG